MPESQRVRQAVETAILEVLQASGPPLSAREIADQIKSAGGFSIGKKRVNQLLYGRLSAFVQRTDEYRWKLIDVEDDVAVPSEPTQHSVLSTTNGVKPKEKLAPPIPDQMQLLLRRLHLAEQIVRVLQNSETPLTQSAIAQELNNGGNDITIEEIDTCVSNILRDYVRSYDTDQYSLRETPFVVRREESTACSTSERPVEEFLFTAGHMDTPALFSFKKEKPSRHKIILNLDHPAYEMMLEVLNDFPSSGKELTTEERLQRTQAGLRLLLTAWVLYEEDLPGPRRQKARDAREDWGRWLRQMLSVTRDE